MTEYYILAWLSLFYALVVLSALVGFWIRNKYFENEKITQIEYGIVSEKPILCKMIASNEENKQASEINNNNMILCIIPKKIFVNLKGTK